LSDVWTCVYTRTRASVNDFGLYSPVGGVQSGMIPVVRYRLVIDKPVLKRYGLFAVQRILELELEIKALTLHNWLAVFKITA